MGLISPHSNNFCASCNRLRVTAEGRLLLCLGNEHSISLRDLLREGASDEELTEAIRTALNEKPERHVFDQPDQPQIMRFMNASGG
jgi:cyclic pyranopterin phosphate synthase